ncbi:hypothetical protein ACHAWF_008649, partial [Thalassiosira exigua]
AAETQRVFLALGEVAYINARYKIDPVTFQSPGFLKAKKNGDLKINLNRAPVPVTTDGQTLGKSKAIEKYLARMLKLFGQTPEGEAIVDYIAEQCQDVKDATRQKGFSKFTRNKTNGEEAYDRKECFEEDLPENLGKLKIPQRRRLRVSGMHLVHPGPVWMLKFGCCCAMSVWQQIWRIQSRQQRNVPLSTQSLIGLPPMQGC